MKGKGARTGRREGESQHPARFRGSNLGGVTSN